MKTKIYQTTLDKCDKNIKSFIKKDFDSSTQFFVIDTKNTTTIIQPEAEVVWVDYELPVLYGFDKSLRERLWQIYVEGDTVYKKYGLVGHKITGDKRVYEAKNTHNKLITTPEQQARRQAKRDWVSQLDKDYHVDPNDEEAVELENMVRNAKKKQGGVNLNIDKLLIDDLNPVNENEEDEDNEEDEGDETPSSSQVVCKPMLCKEWESQDKCYKYFDFEKGFYVQPKLDGIRALVTIVDGKVRMYTRTSKEFKFLDGLKKDIFKFLQGKEGIYLDGEIYAHKLHGKYSKKGKKYIYEKGKEELPVDIRFNALTGMARPTLNKPHVLEDQACLYVFDVADVNGKKKQDERFKILDGLFKKAPKNIKVKRVETNIIYSEDEMQEYHDKYFDDDYEGVILRSRDLVYTSGKRSLYIRKYKSFEDKEFEIVDMECDEGVSHEHFRWTCYNPDTDSNFSVKPKGPRELKLQWYDNYQDYIGKMLTVRFQTQPDSDVVQEPRFPRGIEIRDYE